jgi:MFS transporter, DHA3 family, macrolide efflux protein
VIRSSPVLPGLMALSFVFYLLCGPIEVALPVHIASDLHGSAALLGTFWAVSGIGAVIGELAAPYPWRWPLWPTMTGIVIGWGLAIVPLGLPSPLGTALGGLIVAVLGARGTLLASAVATIALGLITTAVLARARVRKANYCVSSTP